MPDHSYIGATQTNRDYQGPLGASVIGGYWALLGLVGLGRFPSGRL